VLSDVDEVVGDHSKADPASHAIETAVSAARQTMTAFHGTDPAFASRAPRLTFLEPSPLL